MDNSKLRQSKDNFYKKVSSSKGFTHQVQPKAEIYQTLIQMLKSDLLLVQDMIVSNSSDIKMYKILSKNPNLVRKLSEIEENPDIKPIIEKIAEASGNAEKISKNYNCSNANELIKKLHLELGYNELLNKKLCDFFILMKMKMCNDETFQETLSKVLPLKTFIEKLSSKITEQQSQTSQIPTQKSTLITDVKEIKECSNCLSILKMNSLSELLESKDKSNKLIPHLVNLIMKYFKNINLVMSQMISEYNDNTNKYEQLQGTEIEKFIAIKESVEKIFGDMKKKNGEDKNALDIQIEEWKERYEMMVKERQTEIEKYQKEIELLQSNVQENISKKEENNIEKYSEEQYKSMETELQSKIENLKKELTAKEKEKNQENEVLKNKIFELEKKIEQIQKEKSQVDSPAIPNEKVNINEIMRKHEIEFKKMKEETNRKLDGEIRELTTKLNRIKEENKNLTLENENLKKQAQIINSKFDPDSYEQVLLEQFETMKSAFVKKIADLTDELTTTKTDTRAKVYELEQELKETQHLKDVFLQQVIQLQKN